MPVSLEDLWAPNLGDAVSDAAVDEARSVVAALEGYEMGTAYLTMDRLII